MKYAAAFHWLPPLLGSLPLIAWNTLNLDVEALAEDIQHLGSPKTVEAASASREEKLTSWVCKVPPLQTTHTPLLLKTSVGLKARSLHQQHQHHLKMC